MLSPHSLRTTSKLQSSNPKPYLVVCVKGTPRKSKGQSLEPWPSLDPAKAKSYIVETGGRGEGRGEGARAGGRGGYKQGLLLFKNPGVTLTNYSATWQRLMVNEHEPLAADIEDIAYPKLHKEWIVKSRRLAYHTALDERLD